MAVLRKRPAGGGPVPRLVVFHDGPGIRGATHRFAEELAAEGHDVVVPDLYHRHGRMIGYEHHEREADPSLVARMRELLGTLTDEGVQADLDATLAALGPGPGERIGLVGFCVGARAVARTLVRLPDRVAAGAMWHPSFLADGEPDSPHLTAGAVRRPLYIALGGADRVQPVAVQQPYLDAVAGLPHVEVEVFPGADHGFTWPGWPNHHEEAAAGAWRRTLALFRSHLPRPGGATPP